VESHSELIGLFLPELAAAFAPGAAASAPSAPAKVGVPPDLDFLALLEQERTLNTNSLPTDQSPPRQILPTSGQNLPPAVSLVPLAALLVKPQQRVLAGEPSNESIQSTPVTDRPRIVGDTELVDATSRLSDKAPSRLPSVTPNAPAAAIPAELPPVTPVSPEFTAAVARPEIPLKPQRLAKQPAAGVEGINASSNRDVGSSDLDPPLGRQSGQPMESNPRATPGPVRFDLIQPAPPELASALPSNSSSSSALAAIPTAPMPATDLAAPAPAGQSPNIPGTFPEIVDSVRTLSDQKGGEMRLRLNPPELGHLDIKVSVSDEQTYVSITASNSNARDVLEQHIGRLRTLLDAAGLNLADAQVSDHGRPHQSPTEDLPEWARAVPPLAAVDEVGGSGVDVAESSHGIDLFA
jgi:hypothetical protein